MKITKENIQLILSIMMVAFSFTWFTLLLFHDVPEGNKELVSAASGFFLGTGLALIYQYYFGSSKGSADKTNMMNNTPPDAK